MRRFGAIWFLAGYLPISNIVQLNATVAEHWLYLPSVGLLIFVAGCAIELSAANNSCHDVRPGHIAGLLGCSQLCAQHRLGESRNVLPPDSRRRRSQAPEPASISDKFMPIGGSILKRRKSFAECWPDRAGLPNRPKQSRQRPCPSREEQGGRSSFRAHRKKLGEDRAEFPCTWMGAVNVARMRHNAHDDIPLS